MAAPVNLGSFVLSDQHRSRLPTHRPLRFHFLFPDYPLGDLIGFHTVRGRVSPSLLSSLLTPDVVIYQPVCPHRICPYRVGLSSPPADASSRGHSPPARTTSAGASALQLGGSMMSSPWKITTLALRLRLRWTHLELREQRGGLTCGRISFVPFLIRLEILPDVAAFRTYLIRLAGLIHTRLPSLKTKFLDPVNALRPVRGSVCVCLIPDPRLPTAVSRPSLHLLLLRTPILSLHLIYDMNRGPHGYGIFMDIEGRYLDSNQGDSGKLYNMQHTAYPVWETFQILC